MGGVLHGAHTTEPNKPGPEVRRGPLVDVLISRGGRLTEEETPYLLMNHCNQSLGCVCKSGSDGLVRVDHMIVKELRAY